MLTILGNNNSRTCDGMHRRDFLRAGALGIGGLTLADVLRMRSTAAAPPAKPKSIIMVVLAGGPSHIDMYDLKPNAPEGIRGEFKPIQTNVPGFDISEMMPLQAKIADKMALVRTVQFKEPMEHMLNEVYSGLTEAQGRPSFGSVISRFSSAPQQRGVPRYVSLEGRNAFQPTMESAMYLGAAHEPLYLDYRGLRDLTPARPMTGDRLSDRRNLLSAFDTMRRDLDKQNAIGAADTFDAKALDMLSAPKVRDAFDVSREPDRVRRRYGSREDKYTYVGKNYDTGWEGEKFLLARRLVEAGVNVVTLRIGSWDHHGNVIQSSGGVSIWYSLRSALPLLDRSIHALVTDLHERGMDKDVAVLVWGEFGRTPKISQAGRDHWPSVGYALFAGGGMKMGQVIGETDSHAALPKTRAVGAQNVLATIYHLLGIDPSQHVPDFSGRPQFLLDEREPIRELF